ISFYGNQDRAGPQSGEDCELLFGDNYLGRSLAPVRHRTKAFGRIGSLTRVEFSDAGMLNETRVPASTPCANAVGDLGRGLGLELQNGYVLILGAGGGPANCHF